jgi:hypothetical protein
MVKRMSLLKIFGADQELGAGLEKTDARSSPTMMRSKSSTRTHTVSGLKSSMSIW